MVVIIGTFFRKGVVTIEWYGFFDVCWASEVQFLIENASGSGDLSITYLFYLAVYFAERVEENC